MNSHVHPLFASALNSVAAAQLISEEVMPPNDGVPSDSDTPVIPSDPASRAIRSTKLTLAEPGSPAADYLTRYYERADRLGINTGD